MDKTKRYEIEGLVLDIPLRFDQRAGIYIEEYPDFMEDPVWTPEGHPLTFSAEDACCHAEEADPGGCPDCGSCRHYQPSGDHTWFGICRHEERRLPPDQRPAPPP